MKGPKLTPRHLIWCLVIISFPCQGKADKLAADSLVQFTDLKFNSSYEKEQFERFLKSGDNTFELMSCIGLPEPNRQQVESRKRLFDHELKLLIEAFPVRKKYSTLQLQRIFKRVHHKVLHHYKKGSFFHEINESGTYNCVSGTAIYSLIFDVYHIDYLIKAKPNHISLVLDPNRKQFIIESTDPIDGFNKFDLKYDDLVSNLKWSTESDEDNDQNTLFQQLYYTDKNIGLKELIGEQYSNSAKQYLNAGQEELAIREFQKSYVLYPKPETERFLAQSLRQFVIQTNFKNLSHAEVIVLLARFDRRLVSNSELETEFVNLTRTLLIDYEDFESYEEVFEFIRNSLNREELTEVIDFHHNYELAMAYAMHEDYEAALIAIKLACLNSQRKREAQSLLVSILNMQSQDEENWQATLKVFEESYNDYPALLDNYKFGTYCLNLYFHCMMDEDLNDSNMRLSCRSRFEKMSKQYPDYEVDPGKVNGLYSPQFFIDRNEREGHSIDDSEFILQNKPE